MSIITRRKGLRGGRAARRRLIDNRRALHHHRLEPLEPRLLLAADLFGAILIGEEGIDEVAPGNDLDIDLFVDNIGDMPASGGIDVDLFAVMGDPFDPDKTIELGTQRFSGTLDPDDFAERSLTVDIPTNAMPGIYTLVAIIDAGEELEESDEDNNFIIGDEFLIFQPDYDLVPGINSVSVPPAIVFGQAADGSVSVNITNPMDSLATLPSGVTVGVQVFAGPDGGGEGFLLNTKDVNVSVSKLAAGKSKSVTVPIQFPNNLPIDTYNLFVFIDVNNALSETNENNNDLVLMESVIVADPFIDLTAEIGAGLDLPEDGFISGAGDVVTVPVEITNRGNVAVPAGQMIRVLAGLGEPPMANFGGHTDFTVGDGPFSVALGDVNGDGRPDIVTANYRADTVSVLLGNGKGGFGAATNIAVGDQPFAVALGDVNGDDALDIVTANYEGGNVSVLLGNGAGGFAAAMNFPAGSSQWAIALGDLNGDDHLDIVTANYNNSASITVLLGDGTGMFGAPTHFGAGGRLLGLALGFVNGDDILDVVASSYSTDAVAVLLGDGDGGFGAAMQFEAQNGTFGVALGDVNGDDHLDVVTGSYVGDDSVAVLLGDGAGNFGDATFFGVGEHPHSVALGDVNGDGLLDIVAPNKYEINVSVLLGDGSGGFGARRDLNTGNGPKSVALGDLNGDGVLDIVTANQYGDSVSVLLGSTNTATASIGGLKPGQTKTVNVKVPIPAGLENMETFFQAVIDTGNDVEESDEDNNTASSENFDIFEGVRDLSVVFGAGLKLPEQPITSGDGTKLKLPIEITNMGNLPLAKGQTVDVLVQVVDAPDGAPVGGGSSGTFDVMTIEGVSISNLAPGKTKKVTLNVTLPTLIDANNYFLQVLIDDGGDVEESNEGNNSATTEQDIDVLFGFIDLTAVKDPAATIPMALVAGAGTTFDLPIILTNGGNVALPSGQKIDIDIFARPVAGGADILLGSANGVSISKLKAGATKKITVKKLLFPDTAMGDFILVTQVDSGGAVAESDEDNNESNTEGDTFFEGTLNQQADQGATPFQLFDFAEPVTLSQLLFVPETHRGALGFGIGEIVFRGANGTTIAPTGASSFDAAMIYAPGISGDGWDMTFSPAGGNQLFDFAGAFADLDAGPNTAFNGVATVNFTDSATNPGDPGRPFGNHAELPINNPNTGDQNDYAMTATATLVIETAGVYDFGFAGDDGGLLQIAGQPFDSIIENSTGQTVLADFFDTGVADTLLCDCLTPNSNSVGRIMLEPGEYDITVGFFERAGGSWFEVFARGNGLFQLLGGDPFEAANESVIGNTIDQSGFSAAYMSGVSDFDDLFDADPTHNSVPADNVFITSDVNRNVPWTFDFGGPVELDGFAASNLTGTMGVANFRLIDPTNRMVISVAEPHVDLVGVKDPDKPLVMSLVADAETEFDYSIIITNNGNIPVPSGPAIFVDVFGVPVGGGEETFLGFAEVSVSGLKPGASQKVTIRDLFFDPDIEGEFDIVAVIDAENDVEESDEDNNEVSSDAAGMTVVVAEPFVDLTATIGAAFSLPQTGIVSGSGQTVTLPIEIMNAGNVPLEAGQEIDVIIGITNAPAGAPVAGGGSGGIDILTQRVSVSGLKPGAVKKQTISFPMLDGLGGFEGVFAVFLDTESEVEESDEDNRFDTPPFDVFEGTRDLTVAIGAGINLPDETITSGDGTKLTIPIEITNAGNLPLASGQMIDVAVFTSPVPEPGAGAGSGGDLVAVIPVSVSNLQPGAVKKQTLSTTLPPGIGAGMYNLQVIVDDGEDVEESDEMNNSATTAGAIDVELGFVDILAEIGDKVTLPTAEPFITLDFGAQGQRVEPGAVEISNPTANAQGAPLPETPVAAVTGDMITVAVTAVDWRDRGDSPNAAQPLVQLNEDHIKTNNAPYTVTLGDLPAGTYLVTSYHTDAAGFRSELIKVFVTDAVGDNIEQSVTGDASKVIGDLALLTTQTAAQGSTMFTIVSNGVDDVAITFDGTDGVGHQETPLAGLTLDMFPETVISGAGDSFKVPIEVTNLGNVPLPNGQQIGWYLVVDPFEGAGGGAVDPHHVEQFASSVIKFSSEYDPENPSWNAIQVLGAPDTNNYGDIATAWATQEENDGTHFITVGFDMPVVATGVTVRETWGNGFVRMIEVRDTKGKFHVVFDGVDPSAPGAPVDFFVDFPPTPFLADAVRVTIDTDHNPDTWEEIDAITLHGIDAIAAGSINAGNLKPDAMKKATASLEIPQSVMDGMHMLTLETFLVDGPDEQNVAPNTATTDPFLVEQGFVDLSIMIGEGVNLPPLLLAGDGSTFDLPIVIQSMGNLPVPSGGTAFINIFAGEEGEEGVQIGMAEVSVSKLKSGATKTATVKKLMIPEGLDGLFHIAADMFDFSAGVNDADEDNNDAETEQAIDVYANFLDLLGFTEDFDLFYFGQRTGRDVPTGDAVVEMDVTPQGGDGEFDFFEVRFAIEMLGDGAGGGGSLPLFDDEGFVFGTNGHAVVEAHFFRVPEMIADFAPGIEDLLTIGGVGEQGPILTVGTKHSHTVPLDDMFFEGLVNGEFFSFNLFDGTSTSMTRLVGYDEIDFFGQAAEVAIIELMLDHQSSGEIEDGEELRDASVRLTSTFTFYVDSFGIVRFESTSRLRGSISGVGSFDRQSNLEMDLD